MRDYKLQSDEDLIAGCRRGDQQAWAELITRYRRLIYAVPFKHHLSAEDAADVFQTVCAILLEHLPSLKDHSRLSAWLITTTSRECWKLLRERKRVTQPPEADPEGDATFDPVDRQPLPEEAVRRLEEQHLVRRALDRLDDRCRQLLHYIFYERRTVSYRDISRSLQMPESSIGPTRARCLAKLKKVLAKLGWR